jgi:hypothetical protein
MAIGLNRATDEEVEEELARGGGLSPSQTFARPNAVERFKATQVDTDVTDEAIPFKDLKAGEGSLSTTTTRTPRKRGGFASFTQGLTSKNKVERPTSQSFGLPSDRMPTFEELGGAIGNIAKFIGGLTRFNKARGLAPGVEVAKTADTKFARSKLSTLTKLHETASITGNKERAKQLEDQINAILAGGTGVEGDIELDIAAIDEL